MDKLHDSRKQFEDTAVNDRSDIDVYKRGPMEGEYKNPVVRKMWKYWQASRASIVVELPEQKEDKARNCSSDDIAYGFNQGVGACAEAIRSIGLSIKGE
jgi:hypothetical protein